MKKITFSLLAIGISLLSVTAGFAQERKVFGKKIKSAHPTTGIVRCVSSEYEEYLQEIDPKRLTEEQFEQWIAPKVEEIKEKMLLRRDGQNTSAVVTIPVVIHIVHSGQVVSNNGRNITDARAISQITVLNQDFRKMLGTPGHNTNPIGADVEIEFCLAAKDPDGNATNGINRINLGNTQWSYSNVQSILKPQTQWDPTKYLNLWVCQFGGDLSGVLGFAQFPSGSGLPGLSGPFTANTDGVVIDWRAFGSADYAGGNYYQEINKGRTTTHEVGHFLGLRHIWGDAGNQEDGVDCSGTDYCADTPNAGWENYDCIFPYDSCPTDPGNDMTENYMDYTNDECMNIFTIDQKARMMAVIQNSPRRSTLVTSTACQPPLNTPSFEMLQGIKLYPNPANNVLNIASGDNLPDSYKIYNSLGQIVTEKAIGTSADLQVNTSNFSNGVYMIKIVKENESRTIQFIKN